MNSIIRIVLLLIGLTVIGSAWFVLVEDWTILDAVYMTVITLSTVGFGEVHELSPASRVFVSIFLALGLGVFLYGLAQVGESVVRAELSDFWRKRKMSEAFRSLTGHFIVCGAGRMGRLLCEDLDERNIPFVVVDRSEEVIQDCHERRWHAICDDAANDEVLAILGISRAAGLAAVLSSDADNLYLVLSARLVSPELRIVARAFDDASTRKLEKAGANRVVSPYESGAAKMSHLLTNTQLNDFVEIISDRRVAFDLAGVPVSSTSPMAGKQLSETDLQGKGIMVVAIRRPGGDVMLAPPAETRVQAGDELFALGDSAKVAQLMDDSRLGI